MKPRRREKIIQPVPFLICCVRERAESESGSEIYHKDRGKEERKLGGKSRKQREAKEEQIAKIAKCIISYMK